MKSFVMTLPISKKDYVNHLYFIMVVPVVLYTLLSLLLQDNLLDIAIIIKSLAILLILIAFYNVTTLFIQNKSTNNIIQVSIIILFGTTIIFSNNKVSHNFASLYYDNKLELANELASSHFHLAIILFIISLVIILGSYLFSIYKAKNQEF